MSFVLRLLIGIVIFILGVILLTHHYQLTRLFGYNSLAERYLGNGGTYTMWKLLGVLLMLGSIFYVF